MKTIFSTITLLVIFFLSSDAQELSVSLKVGDKAPALSAFKWIKGTPVDKFEEDKIYVVEFGATWCKPCAAAIPELTAIAKEYHDVTVISMFVMESNSKPLSNPNPLYVANVEKYIAKREGQINYTVAVDNPQKDMETTWLRAAGKIGVPYMYVIDKKGMINSISSNTREVRLAIENIVQGKAAAAPLVEKPQFDHTKLLLIDGNGGSDLDFIFRSVLTYYDGKIRSPNPSYVDNCAWVEPGSKYESYKDRFQIIGASLSDLYYMAYADTVRNVVHFRGITDEFPDTVKRPHLRTTYGKYWFKPVLEIADISPFLSSPRSTRNRYNYSLKVPPGTGTASFLQKAFQNDLKTYFGYEASVETRKMPCWLLTVKDRERVSTKLISNVQSFKFRVMDTEHPFVFKNAIVKDIITMLGANFGYGGLDYGRLPLAEQAPFIDETGITEKIDFIFDERLSFDEIKKYLDTIGLEVTKGTRPMKVVVIRDRTE